MLKLALGFTFRWLRTQVQRHSSAPGTWIYGALAAALNLLQAPKTQLGASPRG
jgi:hypothetical protein